MISIIVPIYNAEKTLYRCINSILNQTYKDFEVLLIDDGSSDSSADIIDEYATKDKRIKSIHKKNGGTATARNYGLDIARGEYIGFVDDDDYIHPRMYELLLTAFENPNVDISCCQFQKVFSTEEITFNHIEKKKTTYSPNPQNFSVLNKPASIQEYLYAQMFSVSVWDKLFKVELFESVRFNPENYYEDKRTSFDLILKAKNLYVSNDILYYYYVHNSSKARNIKARSITDFLKISEEILPLIIKDYPELTTTAYWRIAMDNFSIAKWIIDRRELHSSFPSAHLKMKKYIQLFLKDKRTTYVEKVHYLLITYAYILVWLIKKIKNTKPIHS